MTDYFNRRPVANPYEAPYYGNEYDGQYAPPTRPMRPNMRPQGMQMKHPQQAPNPGYFPPIQQNAVAPRGRPMPNYPPQAAPYYEEAPRDDYTRGPRYPMARPQRPPPPNQNFLPAIPQPRDAAGGFYPGQQQAPFYQARPGPEYGYPQAQAAPQMRPKQRPPAKPYQEQPIAYPEPQPYFSNYDPLPGVHSGSARSSIAKRAVSAKRLAASSNGNFRAKKRNSFSNLNHTGSAISFTRASTSRASSSGPRKGERPKTPVEIRGTMTTHERYMTYRTQHSTNTSFDPYTYAEYRRLKSRDANMHLPGGLGPGDTDLWRMEVEKKQKMADYSDQVRIWHQEQADQRARVREAKRLQVEQLEQQLEKELKISKEPNPNSISGLSRNNQAQVVVEEPQYVQRRSDVPPMEPKAKVVEERKQIGQYSKDSRKEEPDSQTKVPKSILKKKVPKAPVEKVDKKAGTSPMPHTKPTIRQETMEAIDREIEIYDSQKQTSKASISSKERQEANDRAIEAFDAQKRLEAQVPQEAQEEEYQKLAPLNETQRVKQQERDNEPILVYDSETGEYEVPKRRGSKSQKASFSEQPSS